MLSINNIKLSTFFFLIIAFQVLSSLPPSTSEFEFDVIQRDGFLPSWLTDHDKKFLDSNVEVLKSKANLIVAKDGTGNFTTVKEAVAAAPEKSKTRFIIYVKRGIYTEIINIGKKKTNLTMIGDGRDSTILTGSLNKKDGTRTYDSATLVVDGNGFIVQDICIQNTAGPAKEQAVALRVSADYSVIYRCRIDAYQDTLYAHSGKQFYRDCYITGTVDFICGGAAAVFQYCQIEARKPIEGQVNMITAQSNDGKSAIEKSGFSFHKCNITASADLVPVKGTIKTYLGRPWGEFATVVFMKSFIDDVIDPSGWSPWNSSTIGRLSTLYYGEYENKGPGADTSKRVRWKGFKIITNPKEASNFTVGKLLLGNEWLNSTGIPYEEGLI